MTDKVVTTSINIINASGNRQSKHRYVVYFAPQNSEVAAGFSALQTVAYLTDPLKDGQESTMKTTSELFAVACVCENHASQNMGHGEAVTLRDKRAARLGLKNNNGLSLLVQMDNSGIEFDDASVLSNAPWGSFQIRCHSGFSKTNRFAVGLGRRVRDKIVAVTLVRCFPDATFTFRPVDRIFVVHQPRLESGKPGFDVGTVIVPKQVSQVPAEAELDGTGNSITIFDNDGGQFTVNPPPRDGAHYSARPQEAPRPAQPPPQPPRTSSSLPRPSGKQSNGQPPVDNADIPTAEELTELIVRRFPEYRPTCQEIEDTSFHLDRLKQFDIVFIVDDTGTMQLPSKGDVHSIPKNSKDPTRWRVACTALEYLADPAATRDKDGVDLYFLIRKKLNKRNIKTGRELLNQLQKNDIKTNGGATLFEPILNSILNRYIRKLENSMKSDDPNDEPRPLDIIVLIDGAAHDKDRTEKLLIRTADWLESIRASQSQVGIQFVQVGEDSAAGKWLRTLYAKVELKSNRDIVDTQTYTDLDDDTNATLGEKLVKIMLSAMDPRSSDGGQNSKYI